MTAAVPGHGFRATWAVTPACKCGWFGTRCGPGPYDEVEAAARQQFEAHKHRVRQELGIPPPPELPLPPTRPKLRVVS